MLTIENIAISYGEQEVLHGVTLEVSAGELVGVIGPNGSGKSTLLRGITRVIPLKRGRVLLGGEDAAQLTRRQLAQRVAVVPQVPVLPEAFTALEVVLLGRAPHLSLLQREGTRDLVAAQRAMHQTHCWHLAVRRMSELSGGERQRVVLARALAQETPVLLLDEPTAHLDVAHQVGTFDLLQRLCRDRHLAVLVVVHDLTLAGLYCDRLSLLYEGHIVAAGPPWQVLTPAHIAGAYGVPVHISAHPQSGRPVVVPLSRTADGFSQTPTKTSDTEQGAWLSGGHYTADSKEE